MPPARKLLALEVLFCVVTVRVLLTTLPFRRIFRCSRWWEQYAQRYPDGGEAGQALEGDLAKLIKSVSRRVPKATCLTQALALQLLLARRRQSSKLCIGVAKKTDGTFDAHAWLQTSRGVIIGGEAGLDGFRLLLH